MVLKRRDKKKVTPPPIVPPTGDSPPEKALHLPDLLLAAIESGASDLHLIPGHPPMLRINTILRPIPNLRITTPRDTEQMVKGMVGDRRFAQLNEHRDLDYATFLEGRGRFRVNAHYQRNSLSIAFRTISNVVPELASLNLPPIVGTFPTFPAGLC